MTKTPKTIKAIGIFILSMVISYGCYGNEWNWEKQDNPNFVSWVDYDPIFLQSFTDGWSVYSGTNMKIGMILPRGDTAGLYDESRKVRDEIVAWRREEYWGSAFDYIWFVKIKTSNGEIKCGYLRPGMVIKTRLKKNKKDIGGFIKEESLSEKLKR